MANITVIGIGAMGGGMARALLESNFSTVVTGYDRDERLVDEFYGEAVAAGKAGTSSKPSSLKDAVSANTDFAVFALVALTTTTRIYSRCYRQAAV